MTLSAHALNLIAEAFGPQSKASIPVSLAPVVLEIQAWLDSQAKLTAPPNP